MEPSSQAREKRSLNLNRLFETQTAHDVASKETVLVLDSEMTVHDALNELTKHSYLSAPVVDSKQDPDADWTVKYLGVLDMNDLVTYTLDAIDSPQKRKERFSDRTFMLQAEELSGVSIRQVVEQKPHPGFWPCSEESTLLDLIIALGKYHLRRLYAVPEKGSGIRGIVTQSDVCRILAEEMHESKVDHEKITSALKNTRLMDVGLSQPKEVFSVDFRQPAVEAFKAISKHNISAVPIVDSRNGNTLVGNISARDIRTLLKEPYLIGRLYEPSFEFLTDMEKDYLLQMPGNVIRCLPTDSLWSVLKKLMDYKIHRVYVIDKQDRVQSVVSLTDFLWSIVHESDWL